MMTQTTASTAAIAAMDSAAMNAYTRLVVVRRVADAAGLALDLGREITITSFAVHAYRQYCHALLKTN
ncbi:hypothetical protein [Mycobacterium sp. OAE908]|uniref:hypothetical protein n=1 Tax=Mycobacterium sp. OAE908 TaxID=2817899 RepID=UPI001AEB0A00